MVLRKIVAVLLLIPLLGACFIASTYAADDMLGGIWATIESILPYILTSPLLFILLFKFWGMPLIEIVMKLKWVVVMAIPTIVLYLSIPEIIDYAVITPPSWFMYLSPPLVIDCIVGYANATGNVDYLYIGLLWLMCIYFISIFLILSGKRSEDPTKNKKSNYYYIFSPLLVWIIFSMWGLLMMNVHSFLFDTISGTLSTEVLSGTGLQIGVVVFVIFAVIVAFLILSKIRSSRPNPDKNMKLLYCKDIETAGEGKKIICVYEPRVKKDGKPKKVKKKKQKDSENG